LLRVVREDARALAETTRLIAGSSENVTYRVLHADALRDIGDVEGAIRVLEPLIRENPARAHPRRTYGQLLHFAGHVEESAREFRAVLDMRPDMGEAWWGLAQLRGNFLTPADVPAMRQNLRNSSQNNKSRMLLQLALGHALEQMGDFAGSFAAYEAGAALAKDPARNRAYDPAEQIREIRRRSVVFTAPVLARCAKPDNASPTPIFIVGLPRSGSTLVEQILASHSLVEATMELPVLDNIIRDLSHRRPLVAPDAYPECVANLTPEQLDKLGTRYIEEAAAYRKTRRPYFTDRRLRNWLESGFIRMILPQAKIIDVRRHPMAVCFSLYKHELVEAPWANDFTDLARHHMEYVGMMAHYNRAMPNHIQRVQYERLVENQENEIRRMLAYCGLPFEEACLRFWKTDRTIIAPSAEQVRRPIYRDSLKQWRNFEPSLKPLKQALDAAQAANATQPQPKGYDLALTFAAMSVYERALKELKALTRRVPRHPEAWIRLAELLRLSGKDKAADEAEAQAARCAGETSKWRRTQDYRTPAQLDAAKRALETSVAGDDRHKKTATLRRHLAENPTDAAALSLLSDLEMQDCDNFTSVALLERSLELSPSWRAARLEFAKRLADQRQYVRALEQATILLRDDPENPLYHILHAEALADFGDLSSAIGVLEALVQRFPANPDLLFRYASCLRSVGKRDASARSYRACLEISPTMGHAYAALADLKGDYLSPADIDTMRTHLADPGLDPSNRIGMHYALGHALERTGDFSASFAAYGAAARLTRGSFLGGGDTYNEEPFVQTVRRLKEFYTKRLLSRFAASQPPAAITPIFVVGMPRAGSTLVEQILASHSQVEGTRELPLVAEIVRELAASRRIVSPNAYPDCVRKLTPVRLAGLGERYLERSRAHRRTDRPYFTDKRPWNWLDAGFIHLILPHAKIIDIRRAPMAACFAMYKQQLPKDAAFSYDLGELGRYYNIYVSLMEHWKSVMPGRIHFVQYESLVEDTENEIRRMLDYCGLPFEENCLSFWETERVVLTPSAEQVRRPIYRDAVEQWRNFEPWLGPVKEALSQPPRI
jgi:predicted Zn-dependent protease